MSRNKILSSLLQQSKNETNKNHMFCRKEMARTNQNLIRDLLRAVQDLGRQNSNQAQPLPLAPNVPNHALVVKQFQRHKPPTFNGAVDPLAAEEWLGKLEHIFRLIGCTDAQKVQCPEFMFSDDASHWWDSMSRTRTPEQQAKLTWEQFKGEVMDKYFPQSLRDHKESEFLQLKQKTMSLTEYERKFDQLSRNAPHLVDTKDKKVRRFEQWLNSDISMILMSHRFTTYREMLERAHVIQYQKTSAK